MKVANKTSTKSVPNHQEEAAPDPARVYERAKPEKESGMGRLDQPAQTPECKPDRAEDAVRNAHRPRKEEQQNQ